MTNTASSPDANRGHGFQIREATLQDAARLAGLSSQLAYPSTPDQIAARLPALQQSSEHAVFVAEAAGEVVGFIHVQLRHALEHDTRAEVASLVVDEKVRSRGAGKALVQAAETWARQRGMKSVVVRSNVIRERAHAFYERLGYRHMKSQKFFRKQFE
jgi:GNAT superfamily N-acetyltransferase